jgi:hypothetical protein
MDAGSRPADGSLRSRTRDRIPQQGDFAQRHAQLTVYSGGRSAFEMLQRLRAFRGLPWPQRFRTRVLLGMLAVALVPLVVFTAIVAADLGAVSRSTVEDTQQTIIEDQEQQQAGNVAARALAIDVRLGGVANEVRQLRDATQGVLDHTPTSPPRRTPR